MAPVWPTKDGAFAWNGIGAAILLASLMINLISVPMNIYNHEQLVELSPGMNVGFTQPVSDILNIALSSEDSGVNRLLMSADAEDADWFATSRRLSGAGSSSSSNSSGCGSAAAGSSAGGHHGSHPHIALIFLFASFMIGAAVMQISARWPLLQQTVLLFIIGFVLSLILKGGKVHDDIGKFGESYTMWMDIDPHLLLFTLLPALLAGDAMTIDTSVAKRVALQCLFLAGPGVIFGGFGTAGFLKLLMGWDFTLCLCAGAILCATDPVAVVALLKELGASPILTVQIQGESLLNDGTAIVLYLVSYNMLMGHEYDAADIAEFLIKKAMMAWAIGLFIGYFFFSWIRAAADKLDHASGMIQITLTLCCAYWSFIFVEGVLQLSGVLATVAASLVLAHHMWPYIVAVESMHHVWHTFEALGNMIVFFLAGAKTGSIFLDIDAIDVVYLILIWFFLLAIRATMMFGSRPVLQYLSADRSPVTWQDATLMVWGGLRGAVGLALALAVNNDRAAHKDTGLPMIEKKPAEQILFFVSGIAFLTTLVNATTAPALVGKLGITALPQARLTLIKMFHNQLVGWAEASNNPPEVVKALKAMLHESEHHIDHQAVSKTGPATLRSSASGHDVAQVHPVDGHDIAQAHPVDAPLKAHGDSDANCQQNLDLIKEFLEAESLYDKVPKDELHRGLIGEELDDNLLRVVQAVDKTDEKKNALALENKQKVDDMIELIREQYVDEGMAKVVNEIFLNLVFQNYWKLIEEGLLRPGSVESEVLMTAVRVSLSPFRADLADFNYVQDQLLTNAEFKDQEALGSLADADLAEVGTEPGWLSHFVAGWQFNVGVGLAIMFNTLQVIAEEIWREPGKPINDHVIWLILDALFTFIFCAEFVAKIIVLRLKYFKSAWNKFDFFLVMVGIFGLVMSIATAGKGAEMAGKTRIIRVARVLRTLRFLRIFRLFHARMSGDKFVSMELAREFKKVTVLTCFCRAHVMAQIDLVKYFGGNGKLDEANESEIARCILQSQVATYRALCQIAAVQEEMGQDVYSELENLYRRKFITENLSKWVLDAHKDGALSATEAHAILHPLNHMVAECVAQLGERAEGFVNTPSQAERLSGRMERIEGLASEETDTSVAVVWPESSPSPPDTSASEKIAAAE